MTETPESSAGSTVAAPREVSPSRDDHRDHGSVRLQHVLAWVGIVAGVVFIVAVIFVSGLIAGRASGGPHGWHGGYQSGQMGPQRSGSDGCPMWGPGGMMGPGYGDQEHS